METKIEYQVEHPPAPDLLICKCGCVLGHKKSGRFHLVGPNGIVIEVELGWIICPECGKKRRWSMNERDIPTFLAEYIRRHMERIAELEQILEEIQNR